MPVLPPHYGLDPDTNRPDPWPDPSKESYDRQVKYWANAAYEEALYENNQTDEIRELSKSIDYLVGKQWPHQRSPLKSKPVNNRIWRLFWELVATLTDIRPLFEIKSLRKDYDQQARILNQVTRSWWMESDADLTLALVIVYSLFCTGYAKLEWNSRLRNGEGDFDLQALSPNEVFALKAKNTLESSEAVIYATPKPLSFFRMKYPIRGHAVRPDPAYSRYAVPRQTPKHLPGMLFDLLSPAMKRVIAGSPAVSDSMFPMAMYREIWFRDYQTNISNRPVYMGKHDSNWGYWVKPGERLYPRGRLIVMGGNEILHDGPNPYWHGRFPFASLRMNIVPWQWHGLSELKPLMPLQDIVNNILAGVLDMVKKAVNPNFIAPKNAFSDAVWNKLDWGIPGAKAQYAVTSPHPPQWQSPPVLPAFVMVLAQMIAREMDASSGIATMSEAVRKKQVPASDTLESMKQAQQTPLRLKGRNVEVFLRHLGSMNISNIFQFYTAERRMFMLGAEGLTLEDFDYNPKNMLPANANAVDHARNFMFLIQPGSLLKVNQDQKSVLLLKLRQMRDLDRKTLFKQLDLGIDPDMVEANLNEEMAAMLAQAINAKMQAGAQMGGGGPIM